MTRTAAFILACLVSASWPLSALAATHDVTVGNFFYSPNDLTIEVGDTVRWTNNSGSTHDVTADDFSWASRTSTSFVYERTFNSLGEILYHCTIHSIPGQDINIRMNGRIFVQEAGSNQPPVADFSSNCSNLDCDFTDLSSDADGNIASWDWDFGDGGSSSQQNPSHVFASAGTRDVSLTVTDDDGASDIRTQSVTVSEPQAGFRINTAISDGWFYPLTNGQGFFIIVWEELQFIFLSWFTYETERPPEDTLSILGEPGHRWLTAQGPYEGDTATLDINLSQGGVFDMPDPPVEPAEKIGTMVITWENCNSAVVSYDMPDLGLAGEIPIQRIVLDNVAACEAAQLDDSPQ